MDDCSNNPPDPPPSLIGGEAVKSGPSHRPPPGVTLPGAGSLPPVAREDTISLSKWFTGYGLFLCLAWGTLIYLILQEPWPAWAQQGGWRAWLRYLEQTFSQTDPELKLFVMIMYLSLCCTFIPLPTGWMVASMATRQASIMAQLAPYLATVLPAALLENSAFLSIGTAVLMGLAGAVGSTLANLNDYHIITLMLRLHKVAKVRNTRAYRKAAYWFAKSPFLILVIFNILTIPVDIIRWLATIYRYPRKNFAAANFVGRFTRYFIIAFVTFYWNLGWIAPVTLLALGATLGLSRVLPPLIRRMRNRRLDEFEEAA